MMLNRVAVLVMVSLAGCAGIPDATDMSEEISRYELRGDLRHAQRLRDGTRF